MSKRKKPTWEPVILTRLADDETAQDLAKRMTKAMIKAINEDRASRGEPPLPKR